MEAASVTAEDTEAECIGNFGQDLKFHLANRDEETLMKYVTVYDVLKKQYPLMKLCEQRSIDSARKVVEKYSALSARENRKRAAAAEAKAAKAAKEAIKKKPKLASKDEHGPDCDVKDDNEWVCSICSQLRSSDGSDLLLCDGECLRSFHAGCLGIGLSLPEGDWFCEQCKNNTHSCFICNEENTIEKPVRKCKLSKCGRYYHRRCVTDKYKFYTEHVIAKADASDVASAPASPNKRVRKPPSKLVDNVVEEEEEEEEEEEDYCVTCPSHFCDVCHDIYGKNQKQILHRCMCCPKAFHLNCILPGSRFNSMCVICPDHPEKALPSLDAEVEAAEPADTASDAKYMWDQLAGFCNTEPNADNLFGSHFLLPQALKTEVEQQTPVYKEISKLDFDSFPGGERALPYHETEEVCDCASKPPVMENGIEVRRCGADCLNRMLQIECYDHKTRGKEANCSLGGDCGNRQISSRKYAKVQPFMEYERGWGLRVVQPVAKGDLILEYIGEVIDQATTDRRMADQRKFTPNDHDFYVMQLENGVFVDGKFKGNHSRFINHSCDPNCELVPTLVRGRMRIGIFAIKDIERDAALSYDYQFETSEAQVFKCCCGAPKCRGTMAPISKNQRDRQKYLSLTKSKRIDKVDRKRMIEVCKRCFFLCV
jgi:hypothetical protein